MKRRMFLITGLAVTLAGGTAFAQSFSDSVVAQLRQQGFSSISVQRTLLGRTQIVAQGNGGRREIILNPRTGEILRDLWITSSGSGADGGGLISDDDGGKGRGRGRGGDDGRDDDDRDDSNDNDGDSSGDDESDSGDDDSGGSDESSGGGDDD